MIRDDSYEYSIKTETSYLDSIGVSDDDIESIVSSFLDDLYLDDDNDDPTTAIDPSMSDTMPFLWNERKTISLRSGTTVDSKNASYVRLWLSSEA